MTVREDVFPGVAAPLTASPSAAFGWGFRRAEYEPEPEPEPEPAPEPERVRHRSGYVRFLDFVTAEGFDPRALATDPLSSLRFLHAHSETISADLELKRAATVFFGNTVAALRKDAAWIVFGDGPDQVGAGSRTYVVGEIVELLAAPPPASLEDGQDFTSDDDWLRGYAASLAEWVDEQEDDARPPLSLPVPVASATVKYRRPELAHKTFLDAEGAAIPYGQRWGTDGPAADSYTVTSNLERFASLHTVAHALIEYLDRAYDVDVRKIEPEDAELMQPHDDVREIVRLSPRSEDGAQLTLVLTGFPGVMVEAGVLSSFAFPACGCDACDEDGLSQAGELEDLVLAVARGGYAEDYPVGRRMEAESAVVSTDDVGSVTGSRVGKSEPTQLSPERLSAAAATLAALPRGWQPWPPRHDEARSLR